MHELSLAQALAATALKHAPEGAAITGMVVEVGELSGAVVDSLEFCLPFVLAETRAAGARVEFVTLPGRAVCLDCGIEFHLPELFAPCPACGSFQRRITDGRQLRLKEIEIRDEVAHNQGANHV